MHGDDELIVVGDLYQRQVVDGPRPWVWRERRGEARMSAWCANFPIMLPGFGSITSNGLSILDPRIDVDVCLCPLHVRIQADDIGDPQLLPLHQDGGIA